MADLGFGPAVRLMAAGAWETLSDRELLGRFVAGQDQAAFAALVQRHGSLVLGVCGRMLQDAQDAEDAFQATFWVLARRAGRVAWQDSVRNWLYQVAFRVAREARARRRLRQRREEEARHSVRALATAGPAWSEVSAFLDEELQRLPAKYRDVLVLCYLEGQTRDKAAEQLGTVVGSVKKRLEQGRELLRRALERRGVHLSAALLAAALDQGNAPAAAPSLLLVSTVRGASAFAASTAGAMSNPIAAVAQGVMHTMFLSKVKVIVTAVLVLALIGVGAGMAWHWAGPAPVTAAPGDDPGTKTAPAEEAKPGQVAVSKPDKHGIVTMLRPVITRLAAGDPVIVALHFATEKGPIARYSDLGDGYHKNAVDRSATVNSMKITIQAPGGRDLVLRPQIKAGERDNTLGLYYAPTYFLTLGDKAGEGRATTFPLPRAEAVKGVFARLGTYTIQISGSIIRKEADAIPFASGPIAVEVGAAKHKSLSEVTDTARAHLRKEHPAIDFKEALAITEDAAGNRLVRFRGPGEKFSATDYFAEVQPDGSVKSSSQRKIGFCVAAGTLIETPTGLRPIEQVRAGDQVWGYDTVQGLRTLTTVRLVRPGQATETLVFGGTLRVTAPHPVYANGAWKCASQVGLDDRLLSSDQRSVRAGRPERISGLIGVFDLTVDEPHNFFAGGFLVHNKDRDYSPTIDDDWYALWPTVKK